MTKSLIAWAPMALWAASLGACAEPTATLVILQNQVPTVDSMTGACVVPADPMFSLGSGKFDIDLDRPYPYSVFPLVQNQLPSITGAGGIEKNALLLHAVRVHIQAPPGVDPGWSAQCPDTFDSAYAAKLDPGQTRGFSAEGFQPCHAARLKELVVARAIPGDLSQLIYFTLNLTIVADRAGEERLSESFPFQVRVCAGCLQSGYPATPTCADAPRPNPFKGNPCNIAQDGPGVLCCSDPGGALICPAPDV